LQSIVGKTLSTCPFTAQQKMAPAPCFTDAGAISAAFFLQRGLERLRHRSRAGSIALQVILAQQHSVRVKLEAANQTCLKAKEATKE
jgi:hypothetical protein